MTIWRIKSHAKATLFYEIEADTTAEAEEIFINSSDEPYEIHYKNEYVIEIRPVSASEKMRRLGQPELKMLVNKKERTPCRTIDLSNQ